MAYTDTEKRAAIAIYITDGAPAAAETAGCTSRTIYRWLGEYNVTPPTDEKAQQRRTETARRHQAKREAIREQLLDRTLDLLDRMDEEHHAVRSYATAVGILIDKYRLEAGEYTDRTYHEGTDDIDRRVQQLVGELKRRAEAEARQSALDGATSTGANPTN